MTQLIFHAQAELREETHASRFSRRLRHDDEASKSSRSCRRERAHLSHRARGQTRRWHLMADVARFLRRPSLKLNLISPADFKFSAPLRIGRVRRRAHRAVLPQLPQLALGRRRLVLRLQAPLPLRSRGNGHGIRRRARKREITQSGALEEGRRARISRNCRGWSSAAPQEIGGSEGDDG